MIGVAGGSMLRVAAREGLRRRAAQRRTSPDCPTPASPTPRCLDGATPVTIIPRTGDPDDYLVLELADGTRVAITITCAANALSASPKPATTAGPIPRRHARRFDIAGRHVGLDGDEVARRMLWAAGEAVCELVTAVTASSRIKAEVIVAVGGGAGGLGRHVADMMRLRVRGARPRRGHLVDRRRALAGPRRA